MPFDTDPHAAPGALGFFPAIADFFSSEDEHGPAGMAQVKLLDVPGNEYILKADGSLTVVASGQVFLVSSDVWQTMIANLADVRGNQAKMETVYPAQLIAAAVRSPRLPAQSDAPDSALPDSEDVKVPLTQRAWFWPTAILGGAVLVGAAVVYWPSDR